MDIFTLVLILLLVAGFVSIFTKYGRMLFDVAVFLILILMLLGKV